MYIAGRLRTASMPPRTLMEVASYLCPEPCAAGRSFSAMSRASPQKVSGFVLTNPGLKKISGSASASLRAKISFVAQAGKAGRAELLETGLAHWPRLRPLARRACTRQAGWDSKGLSVPHPGSNRKLRRAAAKLFTPFAGGAPDAGKALRWRNPERKDFSGAGRISQDESAACGVFK